MKVNAVVEGVILDVYQQEKKRQDGVEYKQDMVLFYMPSTRSNLNIKVQDEAEFKKLETQIQKNIKLKVELQEWAFNGRSGMSATLLF